MSGTSGRTSRVPLAFYDPESSCWKTSAITFDSDCGEPLETLPAWGMTQGGVLYELPTPAPLTDASGCSLLPTPRTSDTNGAGTHGSGGPDLRTVVSLLPTPTARDWKDGACLNADVPDNGLLGRVAVRGLLPPHLTPTETDGLWET